MTTTMTTTTTTRWSALLALTLTALLSACGGPAPVDYSTQKRVVVGTAEHMQARRDSTRLSSKTAATGVSHSRHRSNLLQASDAPHPFTRSSGMVFLHAKPDALAQVAFHENAAGTVSSEVPSRFAISDASVVARAEADPSHPNGVSLTLTGKKGNSYITALNERGDALSKFMVLAAVPRGDVLVVSDPDIHPVLCGVVNNTDYGPVCDLNNASPFDQGNNGAGFDINNFVKTDTRTQKAMLFDRAGYAKLKQLNGDIYNNNLFKQRAIYFEAIDTLVVLNDGETKATDMAAVNFDISGKAIPAQWMTALTIHHVATQEEFNDYIDYGNQLSASPLRHADQTDTVVHEVTPDSPLSATLVGVQLSDGSELPASASNVQQVMLGATAPVKARIYRLQRSGALTGDSPVKCYITGQFGLIEPKFSLKSFKSKVTTSVGGDFNWNRGKPELGVKMQPLVDIGGQVEAQMSGGVGVQCSVELVDLHLAEFGVPILGHVGVVMPLEAKAEFSIDGSVNGKAVMVTPHFTLSNAQQSDQVGEVGFSYSPDGGLQKVFNMKPSLARRGLGFADGTELKGNLVQSFGAGYKMGIAAGLLLRAEVKAWLFSLKVDANVAEALLGVQVESNYTINQARQSYAKGEAKTEGGIGLFFTAHPSISVHSKFFNMSFNLFDLGKKDLYFSKFPFEAEAETALEPSEELMTMALSECFVNNPVAGGTQCEFGQGTLTPRELNYGSQQISFPYKPMPSGGYNYFYRYVIRDKESNAIKVVTTRAAPVDNPSGVLPPDTDKVVFNKYGLTDILAESISTERTAQGGRIYVSCWAWIRGSAEFTPLLKSCPIWE